MKNLSKILNAAFWIIAIWMIVFALFFLQPSFERLELLTVAFALIIMDRLYALKNQRHEHRTHVTIEHDNHHHVVENMDSKPFWEMDAPVYKTKTVKKKTVKKTVKKGTSGRTKVRSTR